MLNLKFMRLRSFLIVAIIPVIFGTLSCKKENSNPSYQIAGLWEGTYVFKSQPPLYFSFTIYPDGSLSYKSKGDNGYTFYAVGSWELNGSTFTYDVTTTNNPGGIEVDQTGTATYQNNGTLSNGVNTDVATGESGTFSMTRVN